MAKQKYIWFLRLCGLIIPIYMLFYPGLFENQEKPPMKSLWNYIFSGLLIQGLFFMLYLISK